MIKRLFLLLLFPLIFTGCGLDELDYDGETKILFEGRIVDENQEPLRNIYVSIYLANEDDTDIINHTTTDNNGYFKMAFPKPIDADYVALLVNSDNYNPVNPDYSNTTIQSIELDGRHGYNINFNDIAIFPLVNATTLSINVNAGEITMPAFNLIGLVDYNYIDFDLPLSDNLIYNNEAQFTVAKNQIIKLKYETRNATGQLIINEQEIIINEVPVTYEFTY